MNSMLKYVCDFFLKSRRHKHDHQNNAEKGDRYCAVAGVARSFFDFHLTKELQIVRMLFSGVSPPSNVKWTMQRALHSQSKGRGNVATSTRTKTSGSLRILWRRYGPQGWLGFVPKTLSSKTIRDYKNYNNKTDGEHLQKMWWWFSKLCFRFSPQKKENRESESHTCEPIVRENCRGVDSLRFALCQLSSFGAFK